MLPSCVLNLCQGLRADFQTLNIVLDHQTASEILIEIVVMLYAADGAVHALY